MAPALGITRAAYNSPMAITGHGVSMVRRVIYAFGRAAIRNQNGPTQIVATRKSVLKTSAERFTINSFF